MLRKKEMVKSLFCHKYKTTHFCWKHFLKKIRHKHWAVRYQSKGHFPRIFFWTYTFDVLFVVCII
jgi:hypothetical protein